MQDRFKFRFLFDNKIYDVVNICFLDNELFIKIDENLLPIRTRLDYKKLMQCTGLKDKNGKLIYEGDIVKYYISINKKTIFQTSEVKYVEELGHVAVKASKVGYYSINPNSIKTFNIEIIGNIYKNPELLN